MAHTKQGKEITKYNALRHGVLARTLLPEELQEAKNVQQRFMDEYQPVNLTETLLVEVMTDSYIRRERALKAEVEYLKQIIDPPVYEMRSIAKGIIVQPDFVTLMGRQEAILVKGFVATFGSEKIEIIDKTYARYITSCERQFYKAVHELQRIQSARLGKKPTSVAVDFFGDSKEEG